MEFLQYLSEGNVVTFFLLLLRMSGLVMFFPFFSHMQVPVVIKSAFAFVLTIFLLP
ncbi:MAG: flagellar biosynthetic protein FliR, partial [Campylobacter sp.]|nr:flagellar biosynthetic protein FliR [Campylobacter sp.]